MRKRRYAFTMLELIFVIIVIGILSAVIVPRVVNENTALYDAARQVVSHIRYTQHLAVIDDVHSNNTHWYRARWQIYFSDDSSHSHVIYTIYSDKDLDGVTTASNPETGEVAKDPLTSNSLTGLTTYSKKISSMNLFEHYSIGEISASGGCASSNGNAIRIFFDHLGRPLLKSENSAYGNLLISTCILTLKHSNGDELNISIEPESGYAHLSL